MFEGLTCVEDMVVAHTVAGSSISATGTAAGSGADLDHATVADITDAGDIVTEADGTRDAGLHTGSHGEAVVRAAAPSPAQAVATEVGGRQIRQPQAEQATSAMQGHSEGPRLRMIPLDSIIDPAQSLRKEFAPEALRSLAASVAAHGVLEPIIVRSLKPKGENRDETYELIAGERRKRGAKAAGVTDIPAIVMDCGDDRAMEIAIVENLQREALTPLDEARAVARFRSANKLSVRATADRLGMGKGWVDERLRWLDLPEDLHVLLSGRPDKKTMSTHARELARVSDPTFRKQLTDRVLNDELTLEGLRQRIRAIAPSTRKTKQHPELQPATPAADGASQEEEVTPAGDTVTDEGG